MQNTTRTYDPFPRLREPSRQPTVSPRQTKHHPLCNRLCRPPLHPKPQVCSEVARKRSPNKKIRPPPRKNPLFPPTSIYSRIACRAPLTHIIAKNRPRRLSKPRTRQS